MGFTKRMAAALPNNIVKNHGTNVNQIQFGDKLQGLVSVTNRRVGVNRDVRTKCGGQLPGRATVHCVNQLGGVGNVKNTQFAPNADGAKECKREVYGETRRDHDYIHRDSDKTTQHVSLPVFSSSIKDSLNEEQLKLVEKFEVFPNSDVYEDYSSTGNTHYATIGISQKDFDNGTLRIVHPGIYILKEDIEFNPNPDNNSMPRPDQIDTYPTMRQGGAYHLGFFAAITIESNDVVLDLRKHTLKQSNEHNLIQRFYANIELASAPFILNQGPGSFTTESSYKAASDVMIVNGTLGRSSHHGLHGNGPSNVVIKDLVIEEFEVAGVALNGMTNGVLAGLKIKGTRQSVPVVSTFSQAVFAMPVLKQIQTANSSLTFRGKTISEIVDGLDAVIKQTKDSKSTDGIPDIFRNDNSMCGYDGNVYGMVLNVNGVVINEFLRTRTADAKGNVGIHVTDVEIQNLVSKPVETIAISKAAERELPKESLAYDGKRQVGAAGDVLDMLRITSDTNEYNGDVLSDAKFIIAKYAVESEKKMGTCNILKEMVGWAENNSPSLDEILHGELDLYYVRNGDSMGHHMKGNIGFFISGGKGITARDIKINSVVNKGEILEPSQHFRDNTGGVNSNYAGADSYGIVVAASQNVDITNASITEIDSKTGSAYCLREIGDTSDLTLNNVVRD